MAVCSGRLQRVGYQNKWVQLEPDMELTWNRTDFSRAILVELVIEWLRREENEK